MLTAIGSGPPVAHTPLARPLSIRSVQDGGTYQLKAPPLVQTNLFLHLGRVDELFVKVPSERGWSDYSKFVQHAQLTGEDIRPLEPSERFEQLRATLEPFPGFGQLIAVDAELAHYLAVHKLQFERLRGQTAVEIPLAKFALLESSGLRAPKGYDPVLFQERVRGTTLWSMFDFAAERVLRRWQPSLPAIASQLAELLDAGLTDHIDWNIKNFVFDETEGRLFYVDLKPTLFVAKRSNAQNLKGIRRHFLA